MGYSLWSCKESDTIEHTCKWGDGNEVNGNLLNVTHLVSCRGRIYFYLLPSHLLGITQYSNENSQIQMSVHSTRNLIPRMVAVMAMQSIQVISLIKSLKICWENMPNIRDCIWYPGSEDELEWIINLIDLIRRGKGRERDMKWRIIWSYLKHIFCIFENLIFLKVITLINNKWRTNRIRGKLRTNTQKVVKTTGFS